MLTCFSRIESIRCALYSSLLTDCTMPIAGPMMTNMHDIWSYDIMLEYNHDLYGVTNYKIMG